jgi:predicted dehydrogenase
MWKWIPAYERVWQVIQEGRLGTIHGVRFTGASNLLLPRRIGVEFPEVLDKESSDARTALVQRFGPMRELVILEYGVHVLDMLRAWFAEPTGLRATTSRINPELEGDDAAIITLRFDGFDADMYIDFCRPGAETNDNIDGETLAILGTAGLLTVTAGKWLEWHPTNGEREVLCFSQDTRDAGFARSHSNFARSVVGGHAPASTPADNLRSQSLVLACYESARQSGGWMNAPSDFIRAGRAHTP